MTNISGVFPYILLAIVKLDNDHLTAEALYPTHLSIRSNHFDPIPDPVTGKFLDRRINPHLYTSYRGSHQVNRTP
jgi:hypothetical protein